MRRLLVAAVVALSCTPSWEETQPRLPAEEVVDRNVCLDIFHCPAFRAFWRPSDPNSGMVRWLISRDRHACVVTESDFVVVPDGIRFACQWRLARGG